MAKKKATQKTTAKKTAKTTTRKKSAGTELDIIELILKDHKPLKQLIKVMKGSKPTFAQKKSAFADFAPLLIAHAKPEEQSWYIDMKAEGDMKIEGIEGDVEHGLADQLCTELKSTTDENTFMAKVKVLAELVEHHIEEEEEKTLLEFRKESSAEERIELGQRYLELRTKYEIPEGYVTTDKIYARVKAQESKSLKSDTQIAQLQ